MIDFKMSNPNLWDNIGVLLGFEYREEDMSDDRDPRLDGTITYTDYEGDTYLVSDVVNSSPTGDVSGSRDVVSVFGEMQIPVTDSINMQAALRHEDFSDYGDSTVGKLAVGWDVASWLDLRASISSQYIIQVNEKTVVRSGTRYDRAAFQVNAVQDVGNVIDSDSRYTIQRMAVGAENLD